MKVGDLITWKYPMPRFAYMIGVVVDTRIDCWGRDRCDIEWACDRGREIHIPIDILEMINESR